MLGDTINTNRLNNSMQDMEDAFHRLNTFTDADLKRKEQLLLRGRNNINSQIRSQVVFEHNSSSHLRPENGNKQEHRNPRGQSVRILNKMYDLTGREEKYKGQDLDDDDDLEEDDESNTSDENEKKSSSSQKDLNVFQSGYFPCQRSPSRLIDTE